MMCGGKSQEKEATSEIQHVLDSIKDDVRIQLGRDLHELKAVSYCSQVVAGLNYFIKAQIADNEFIHIRVHRPLGDNPQPKLHSIQDVKSKTEPINYF